MPRAPSLLVFSLFVAATFAGGCGDDDETPDATATLPVSASPTTAATATMAPSSSPTVTAGIIIEQPAEETVRVPIAMSGRANVFEGALTIDAIGAGGDVLCIRHIQASSGSGTEGTWADVLAFPPPSADSPVTLRAYTFSAADGSIEGVVERSVTVESESPNIVVTSPSCAADVTPGVLNVTGTAQVFEAALSVDIRHSSGVVMTQNVTAASGTERSPWTASFDLTGLAPGFYDVVAYSFSAMDGSIENQFSVQFLVGP